MYHNEESGKGEVKGKGREGLGKMYFRLEKVRKNNKEELKENEVE